MRMAAERLCLFRQRRHTCLCPRRSSSTLPRFNLEVVLDMADAKPVLAGPAPKPADGKLPYVFLDAASLCSTLTFAWFSVPGVPILVLLLALVPDPGRRDRVRPVARHGSLLISFVTAIVSHCSSVVDVRAPHRLVGAAQLLLPPRSM